MLDTLAEAGQMAADGGDPGLRDRAGVGALLLRIDPRRAEVAQPQGQLRPGQHAPLRHGRPDPRRRDPRPRHPERPRQGRPPPRRSPASGARRSRSAKGRSISRRFLRTLKAVGYTGPLVVEREVGDQAARIEDVRHGLDFLRSNRSPNRFTPADADPGRPQLRASPGVKPLSAAL